MTSLLFIDDEEGVRRSVKRAMKKESHAVFTAKDGKTGIRLVEKLVSKIGVVVSDYKMPGLDGLETLRAIATINPEITRILLTGYATMRSAIRATNEGLDGFLTKPFDNMELRKRIREITIRKRLKQFVSEQIYNEIKTDPHIMLPRKKQVTVLFTDIRGFTSMSQKVPPEKIAAFLNESYFTPLGEIAHQHNGTVDKHIGDSMMVVYGAPVSRKDDIVNAIESAVDMQLASKKGQQNTDQRNGFPLHMGIGVCTGEVVTGVFGSLRKKEYTAFGMAVNIAARLEKLAQPGEILIDEKTYQEIGGQFNVEKKGEDIPIKGLDTPMPVYRIRY